MLNIPENKKKMLIFALHLFNNFKKSGKIPVQDRKLNCPDKEYTG